MAEIKLTPAQERRLREIAHPYCSFSLHDRPAKALVAKGLAQWRNTFRARYLDITPAGRSHLASLKEGSES